MTDQSTPSAAAAASEPSPSAEASTSAPEKRGRGRPRKDAAAAPVSPSEASAANGSKAKPVPKKKGKVTFDTESLGTLAKQVEGLHQLVALATGIPELQVRHEEAAMLSTAIAAVCEEYDLSLSGKTGALLQLAAAAAMVYAPRFGMVMQRVKQQQAAARQRADLRVVGGTDGADPAHA